MPRFFETLFKAPAFRALGLCAAAALAACQATDVREPQPPAPQPAAPWDSAFSVAGVDLAAGAPAVARALVRAGDPGRMDAFLRKCRSKGEVRIGFMGGSVTGGGGVTAIENRYSTRFCAFLGRLFPGTRFTEINAAIGATNSLFACARAQTDLLSKYPDLTVLEFAINDDYHDSALVSATMEGLIRKCAASSYAPVLLYHTMVIGWDTLGQHYQERLAARYDLPVVSFLKAIAPELAAGRVAQDSVMFNIGHPNDRGHLIGGMLLYRAVERAYRAWIRDSGGMGPGPTAGLPAPLIGDFYQRAGLMEAGDSTIRVVRSVGWSRSTDGLGRDNLTAAAAGAEVELESSAGEVSIGYLKRIDQNAEIEVRVDGEVADTLRSAFPNDWGGGFTKFDVAYRRPWSHAQHKIVLKLVSGESATLQALMYAGK
jgi:hypothetical protein